MEIIKDGTHVSAEIGEVQTCCLCNSTSDEDNGKFILEGFFGFNAKSIDEMYVFQGICTDCLKKINQLLMSEKNELTLFGDENGHEGLSREELWKNKLKYRNEKDGVKFIFSTNPELPEHYRVLWLTDPLAQEIKSILPSKGSKKVEGSNVDSLFYI